MRKLKKNSSEPLEIHIDSPISKKDENFPIFDFVHLPNCQSLSNGYDFHIYVVSVTSTQRVLYLCISVTSNQRVKTVIFAEKKIFFFKRSNFEYVPNCQALDNSAKFSMFFYLTNLKYLWKISLIWPICRNQKVKTVKNGGQDAFFMWHFQIH